MNLKPETRKGFYITAEMKRLWAVEMDLLNKLLEVCKKHNLRIWADGGTLLGTVREHGYIPWDDDIDMAMLRDDYDKLIAISQEEFKAPYYFQCGYTEKNYPRGHAQLRKNNTSAILNSEKFYSFHQGIFIDIFVYDVIPDDKEKLMALERSVEQMRYKLKRYCKEKYFLTHPIYSLKLFFFKLPIYIKGFSSLFKEFDDLLKNNEGHEVACIGFTWDLKTFRRNLSLYDNTLYVPFEEIMMPIPSGYDAILRTQYGDYMKPVQAPTYHGDFAYLDTNKSYKYYLKVIEKQIKKDIIKSRTKKIKNLLGIK